MGAGDEEASEGELTFPELDRLEEIGLMVGLESPKATEREKPILGVETLVEVDTGDELEALTVIELDFVVVKKLDVVVFKGLDVTAELDFGIELEPLILLDVLIKLDDDDLPPKPTGLML